MSIAFRASSFIQGVPFEIFQKLKALELNKGIFDPSWKSTSSQLCVIYTLQSNAKPLIILIRTPCRVVYMILYNDRSPERGRVVITGV